MKPLLDPPPDHVAKSVRVTALIIAGYLAGVHLALAQDRYELDAPWVGTVFVAAALGVIVGAAIAAGGDRFGVPVVWAAWVMAAIAAAGMFAGFLLSRTVGLPGYHRPDDWPVIQVIALVGEVAYLVLFAVAVRSLRRGNTQADRSDAQQLAA